MPTLEEVNDFVYSNLTNVSVSRNGQHFHGRCPLCGDSSKNQYKKRFHLQFDSEDSIYWQCWNCSQSGNFYELYAQIEGVSTKEAYKLFNKYNSERILDRIFKKQQTQNNQTTNQIKHHSFNYILNDCISLNDTPDGYITNQYYSKLKEFINTRQLDYKCYIAYKGEYKGRIIIPIWDNDNLIYFQGRSIYKDQEPKYKNPSVEKQHIILNKNNFDRNKCIGVTEGIIDANMIGVQGTTILGKELTQQFIDTVKQYTDKDIIVIMDNDIDGIDKLNQSIDDFNGKLKYFILPRKYRNSVKDLNDLVQKNFINKSDVYQFIVDNSYNYLKAKFILTI